MQLYALDQQNMRMAGARRKSMKVMIQAMQDTLNREKPPRLTALKGLQMEEKGDPFKILIGTILSARSRDENTTKVVHRFFERYKTAEEVARADIDEIKDIIHSIGFFNVKANRIKEVARMIVQRHGGRVPSSMEDLLKLPGVGRKTANCVLVYAFDKPAIPVDIHVHRISNRIGLVKTKTPEQTEIELVKIVDKRLWTSVNDTFVMYGQNICLPIKPRCSLCKLKNSCRYYESNRKVSAS
jgi:endonuclease-3